MRQSAVPVLSPLRKKKAAVMRGNNSTEQRGLRIQAAWYTKSMKGDNFHNTIHGFSGLSSQTENSN